MYNSNTLHYSLMFICYFQVNTSHKESDGKDDEPSDEETESEDEECENEAESKNVNVADGVATLNKSRTRDESPNTRRVGYQINIIKRHI